MSILAALLRYLADIVDPPKRPPAGAASGVVLPSAEERAARAEEDHQRELELQQRVTDIASVANTIGQGRRIGDHHRAIRPH